MVTEPVDEKPMSKPALPSMPRLTSDPMGDA